MQAIAVPAPTSELSDPLVQQHFDASARLYVDHALACYRTSVEQRLELLLRCGRLLADDVVSVLDIGCGGGAFLDMFLERFENAHATGIDISQGMLNGNVPCARKTLVQGDALALPKDLGEFDVVCVDTVMHHLISRKGYGATRAKILQFLRSLHQVLRPGASVVIREIYHEYRWVESLGSRAIFAASMLRVPEGAASMLRAAGLQTANVGVCFQTRTQWRELFAEAGFAVTAIEDVCWPGQPYRRFGFAQSGDLHFVLNRSRPAL